MGIFDGLFGASDSQTTKPVTGGLLGNFDPQTIGLLSAGAAGLQASGPSLMPVSTGQAIGKMLGGYLQGYGGALDHQMKLDEHQQIAAYRKAQAAKINQQLESEKSLDNLIMSRLSGMPGASGFGGVASNAFSGQPMDLGTPGGTPDLGARSAGGQMRAARISAQTFADAATKAGLGTDNATLNRIVDLVNQGMEPDDAAQSVKGGSRSVQPGMAPAAPGGEMSPKIGGPDWLQSYQAQNQQSAPSFIPQQPALRAPTGSQPFPFTLNDIAMLKLKGKDLTDVYKLATDPIQLSAGNMYKDRVTGDERYIPKLGEGMTLGAGGSVNLAPGYLSSNNAVKSGEAQAQELAKASFDPFYGSDGQGNKVMLGSRARALGFGSGFGGGTGQFPQQGGQGGGFGSNPIVTERNAGATTYDNEVAKTYAERYKAINNAGFMAPSQIAKLQRIGQLLDDHDGGKFSTNSLALSQYANSLGVKLDSKLGNKEAAAALSNELALSLRDPSNGGGMPGAMSDADRQFLSSMAPGLSQSKEGRQQMIGASVALQKRNMQVMQMASKYQKKYGRVDDGFYTQLQDWAERNPLFGGQ